MTSAQKKLHFLMNATQFAYLSVKLGNFSSRNVTELLLIWWIYFNYAMILASTAILQSFVTYVNFFF